MLVFFVSEDVAVFHSFVTERGDDDVLSVDQDYVSVAEQFCYKLKGAVSCGYFEGDDAFEFVLLDLLDFSVSQVLAQDHAEVWWF